jgi:ribosomal 50S subunit-recycling heat shock protein
MTQQLVGLANGGTMRVDDWIWMSRRGSHLNVEY